MPWFVVILFVVLAIVAYYFWRSQNERLRAPSSEDEMSQTFDFPEQAGAVALNRRTLRIIAPTQIVRGKKQKIRVELAPLPAIGVLKPPPEKGIDALLALVVNPMVLAQDTGDALTAFDPPLTITVQYKKEDAAETSTDEKGIPKLSIVCGYEAEDGWRFEKLPTTVTPDAKGNGGTLTAQLKTLAPKDPLWVGKP